MRNNKPRVIFVGPVPPPFMGPSLATEILLASRLGELFELIHLDTSHHKDLTTLGKMGLRNVLFALRHYWAMLVLIVRHRPQLVYIPVSQTTVGYFRDSGLILIAKLFRRPVVCHLRGGNFRNWYESSPGWVRAWVRFVHGKVDAQIVLGKKLIPLFDGLMPANRLFVVPNGRDFPELGNASVKVTGADSGVRILYLSNLIESKGVLDVVESMPAVLEEFPTSQFIFAGQWFQEFVWERMQEAAEKYGAPNMRLIDKISGTPKYDLLRSSDIFIFPTYYPPEGHPWAIVEAMAAGLPVVSTDHAAISESVIDGDNGFLVEKKNPADISEKLKLLCRDQELRERMGLRSRELYEQNFTEERTVTRMARVFDDVLAHRSGANGKLEEK